MTRRKRWTARRWLREYVRAYLDLLAIAERWIPPLHWHVELYRQSLALRRDAVRADEFVGRVQVISERMADDYTPPSASLDPNAVVPRH